jgi:hypothetical protein
MKYSSSSTQSYNGGYIQEAYLDGHQVIRVQVDPYAYPMQVKSIQSAKLMITKHVNTGRSLAFKRGAK